MLNIGSNMGEPVIDAKVALPVLALFSSIGFCLYMGCPYECVSSHWFVSGKCTVATAANSGVCGPMDSSPRPRERSPITSEEN